MRKVLLAISTSLAVLGVSALSSASKGCSKLHPSVPTVATHWAATATSSALSSGNETKGG